MKRLISLAKISLSLLLASAPDISALEIGKTELSVPITSSLLAAKAKTNRQFVNVDKNNHVEGTLRIVEENGQRYFEFGEDFETSQGPDLEIILHIAQTVPVNITEGSYLTLAPIQSFTGTQRYAIPNDVDLDEYGSVAVWCEEFNVTFGYARL